MDRIKNHSWVRGVIKWAKTTSMPGFSEVPFYDVVVFVVKEAQRDDIVTRANGMAFSFLLSLFPFIIVLFSVIAFLPIDNVDILVRNAMHGIMPANAESFILEIIDDITSIQRGGLLSIGFLLAIFFASNGMLVMMSGFDKSYERTFRSRNFLKNRLVAIGLTILFGVLLIASIISIFLGNIMLQTLFDFLQWNQIGLVTFQIAKWIVTILLYYTIIAVIYRYGAAMNRRISFFSPGTTLATVLCILTSVGFSFFINNFGTYNKIYGSIGALLAVMVWMQLNCFNLLVGFELNASIAVNRDLKEVGNEV